MQRFVAAGDVQAVGKVSILIRPEGRMQLVGDGTINAAHLFQSSSGQKAGCNHQNLLRRDHRPRVSILIRPEGRMQPSDAYALRLIRDGFQSSSGQKAGCNLKRFNPFSRHDWEFQSSSGQKAGCNPLSSPGQVLRLSSFNPHPARRPDATFQDMLDFLVFPSFNPHPARRPDATVVAVVLVDRQVHVSILIRPEGRMQPSATNPMVMILEVSILIRPEGRMQQDFHYLGAHHREFQSSSGQKAGCNTVIRNGIEDDGYPFQSSSGQKAGCNNPS